MTPNWTAWKNFRPRSFTYGTPAPGRKPASGTWSLWPDGITLDGTTSGLIAGWRNRAILAEKKNAALLAEIALIRRQLEDTKAEVLNGLA